ncbi:hypothetical protein QBC35DRAFT_370911 [Podospora australis]|uniref:Uncharacterized protein n=1 Tax=Podospora australis TaxID=1536484 RepID=A0AAN6X4T0_9PEZI|nr:hypothetical protein QBC35DRAFT_370911 [Podospora australis]
MGIIGGQHAGVEDEEVHGSAAPSNVSGPRDTTSRLARHPPVLQNADLPPIAFPGGKNPYLDRPLPPRPPPKNAVSKGVAVAVAVSIAPSTMPARPSTSSGPSSKSAAGKPNFDKRLSKDDMALNGRMGIGKGKGLQPYIVGIKSGPLTPEPSPGRMMRTPSPAPTYGLPPRALTPESVFSGDIPIGMALGSPTQIAAINSPYAGSPYATSPYSGWQPQGQAPIQEAYTPPPVQPIQRVQPAPEPTIQRTKTQKRRLFGSLFGSRKNTEQAKAMEAAGADRSAVSITVTSPQNEVIPARSNTVGGKKAPKHKPIVIRANTMQEPTVQRDWRNASEPAPSLSPSGPGLLDIEIPDVRLERYSIMFSGVLNSASPAGPRGTLLERRQATLEKLKTINDRIVGEEEENARVRQRRATSPQPMKSPGFTLFPQAMSSTASLAVPRKLSRSNTSPAHLPSPSRASFDIRPQQAPRRERKSVKIVSPRTMDEQNRAAQVEKLREQQAAQQAQRLQPPRQPQRTEATGSVINPGFYFGPNESTLMLDSPNSISSFGDEEQETANLGTHAIAIPLRPAVVAPEPEWQMISPPTSTSSSSSAASDSASSKRTMPSSAASSVTTRPSLDTLKSTPIPAEPAAAAAIPASAVRVEEDDAALKAAVEISIARQISISRQQSKMLRPLGAGATMSSSSAGAKVSLRGRSATVGTVTTGSRPVIETKIVRVPTLVVVGGRNGREDIRRSELVEVVDP